MTFSLSRHGQFGLAQFCPRGSPESAWARFVHEAYACPFCDRLIWLAMIGEVSADGYEETKVRDVTVLVEKHHAKRRFESKNGCGAWLHPAAAAGIDLLNFAGVSVEVLRDPKNRQKLSRATDWLRQANGTVRVAADLLGGAGELLVRTNEEKFIGYHSVDLPEERRLQIVLGHIAKLKKDPSAGGRPRFEDLPEFAGELEYEDLPKKRRRRRRGGKRATEIAETTTVVELEPGVPGKSAAGVDHEVGPDDPLEALAALQTPLESLSATRTTIDSLAALQTPLDALLDLDRSLSTIRAARRAPKKSALDLADALQLLLPGM